MIPLILNTYICLKIKRLEHFTKRIILFTFLICDKTLYHYFMRGNYMIYLTCLKPLIIYNTSHGVSTATPSLFLKILLTHLKTIIL